MGSLSVEFLSASIIEKTALPRSLRRKLKYRLILFFRRGNADTQKGGVMLAVGHPNNRKSTPCLITEQQSESRNLSFKIRSLACIGNVLLCRLRSRDGPVKNPAA